MHSLRHGSIQQDAQQEQFNSQPNHRFAWTSKCWTNLMAQFFFKETNHTYYLIARSSILTCHAVPSPPPDLHGLPQNSTTAAEAFWTYLLCVPPVSVKIKSNQNGQPPWPIQDLHSQDLSCSSTKTALCQKVLTDFPAEYRQRDPRIAWTLPLPEPRSLSSHSTGPLYSLLPIDHCRGSQTIIQLPTGVQASHAQDSQKHSPQPLY